VTSAQIEYATTIRLAALLGRRMPFERSENK